MDQEEHRQKEQGMDVGFVDSKEYAGNAEKAEYVYTHEQGVISVKYWRPMEKTIGELDQTAENRRGIGGVCQPIPVKVSHSGMRQSVQKILVLIGSVERRLAVCHGKKDCPQQEVDDWSGFIL